MSFTFSNNMVIELAHCVSSTPNSTKFTLLSSSGRTFKNPKILKSYSNVSGDSGFYFKPQIDSFCLICYSANDFAKTCFILGWLNLQPAPEEKDLGWNDLLWRVSRDSYILLKANGQIDFESNPQLYLKFNPNKNIAEMMAEQYFLYTNGGKIEWTEENNMTTLNCYIRNTINDQIAHKINFSLGNVDNKRIVAVNINDKWRANINFDGETNISLNSTDLILSIKNDGTLHFAIGKSYSHDISKDGKSVIKCTESRLGSDSATEPIPMGYKLANLLATHVHPGPGQPSPQLTTIIDTLSKKHKIDS